MDFQLSDEQRLIRESLSRLLQDEFDFETRMAASQSAEGFSPQLWSQMAELGLLALPFSAERSGFGSGADIMVAMEELGRALASDPFLPVCVISGGLLEAAGADDAIIDDIISGSKQFVLAHEEADAHYTLSHVSCTASEDGDGFILNGQKAMVPFVDQADGWIVSARTSGATGDEDGISLFLVSADTKGTSVIAHATTDGGRAGDLILDNVKLDRTSKLDSRSDTYAVLEMAWARGICAVAAEAVGIMDVVCDLTLEYLKTRKQFGRPIGSFQVLQHAMVDMRIKLEEARSMAILAAGRLEADRAERETAMSAAKAAIGQCGRFVSETAIQLHGGIGMTWEMPMAHFAKRLITIDHLFGDTDHHLQRFSTLNKN